MEGEPVGAAAVAARLAPVRLAARPRQATCELAFDRAGGPVVAVCGLAGGVGSSTLALALSRQAALESCAPVLVIDAATTPGLAALAGARSPRSLGSLADALVDGDQPAHTFAEFSSGLRLIATRPERRPLPSSRAVRGLMEQARDAHGLVVVDCGSAWMSDATVLGSASHVVWMTTATATGLSAAREVFSSPIMPTPKRTEVVVARHVPRAPSAKVRAVRRLAHARRCRLVLLADDERGALQNPPAESVLRGLAGIAPTLRSVDR